MVLDISICTIKYLVWAIFYYFIKNWIFPPAGFSSAPLSQNIIITNLCTNSVAFTISEAQLFYPNQSHLHFWFSEPFFKAGKEIKVKAWLKE